MSDHNPLHEAITSSPEGRRASEFDATVPPPAENGTDTSASLMQTLEDTLQRGASYARENPLVAVVGVASVAALLVIATKKSAPRQNSLSRLEHDLRAALTNAPSNVNGAIDTISGAVGRAFSADPKNVQMVQDAATHWMQQAQNVLKPYIPVSLAKR